MTSAHVSIIIMAVAIVVYVSNKLPIPITAMLSASAMVVFGIIPANQAFASLGQDNVLILFGFLLIGSALFSTGAAGIVGDLLIKIAGGKPKFSILLMFCVSGIMSFFLSNVAVVVMFAPLILSVIIEANDKKIYEQKYMQALCVTTCCTGLVTLVGSPVNVAASGLVVAGGHPPFTFTQMAGLALILTGVALVYAFTIGDKLSDLFFGKNRYQSELVKNFIAERENVKKKALEEKSDPVALKKANKKRITITVIMILTVAGIVTNDFHGISMGTISVLGGIATVLFGCIPYKEMYARVDWGILLMITGTVGCATGLGASGGGRLIANFFLGLLGDAATPMSIFVGLTVLAAILTQFLSNSGTIGVLIPIGLAMAEIMGFNYLTIAIGITMSTSMSFMTPMGTPTQAAALNWGSYKFSDYFKYSGPINVILVIVIIILTPIFYPLV